MLTAQRLGACALAVTMSLGASAAQADNLSVLIMDGSFFPSVIYAQPGDNVIFTNMSQSSHTVSGPEASWTSGPIPVDGTFVLNLTHNTPLTFTGATEADPGTETPPAEPAADGTGEPALEEEMAGEISYDPEPI